MTEIVYVIEAEGLDAVKIGKSTTAAITKRFSDLASGCPTTARLLATCSSCTERLLHEQFAKHRTHREWFRKAEAIMAWVKRHERGECKSRDRSRLLPFGVTKWRGPQHSPIRHVEDREGYSRVSLLFRDRAL